MTATRPGLSPAWAISLVLALGLAWSCSDEPLTQLVVVVNSNYRPAVELASVRAKVGTRSKEWSVTEARRGSTSDAGPDQTALPFSFGVTPPHGDTNAAVDITVEGYDPEHVLLVRRRVHVGFVKGKIKRLDVDLLQSCAALFRGCEDEGKTCIAGRCQSTEVNAADLDSVPRGSELAGVHPLDWWCDAAVCDDAAAGPGDDGSIHSPEAGMHEDGSSTTPADSGPDSSMDSGGAGTGGAGAGGAGAGGDGGGAGSGPEEPQLCGPAGLFRYVGRTLASTRDSKPCTFLAEDTYYDPDEPAANLTDNANGVSAYVASALSANADVVHLDIAQAGNVVQVTGRNHLTTLFPSLQSVLAEPSLRVADQPIKLTLAEGAVTDAAEFATALLDVLLASQPDADSGSSTGYARDCRPVFLVSTDRESFDALTMARELIMSDADYAKLRGHVQFGQHLGDQNADYAMLIDQAAAAGFELIEPEISTPNLKTAVDYARSKDLYVAISDLRFEWQAPLLCGLADAASLRNGLATTRATIASSRRMIDLDVAPAPADIWLMYRGDDGLRTADLGDGEGNGYLPKVAAAEGGESLRGGYLMFDASKAQSLALYDADDPFASGPELALAVVVRFRSLPAVDGERHVIVSKRQGSSGWAIELARAGSTQVLQIRVFVDDGQGVQELLVPFAPAALNTSDSYYIYAAFTGYFAGIGLGEPDPNASSPAIDHGVPFAIVQNSAPVTLGADPGTVTDTFDGDLQLFRLMSY